MLNEEEDLEDHKDQIGEGINGINMENTNASITHPDQPLWRGRHYDLLNNDISFYRRAKVVVCFPDEPFNEDNLSDIDVRILFQSDGDL